MLAQAARAPLVLIVEDEPLLRMMAVDMVEAAGFEVLEAASAAEAIVALEQHSDIRIVFTDIDMPRGIDGLQMAALIRHRWPPIEIIITSGHYRIDEIGLPPRIVFFAKPYAQDKVISTMRRMAA